MANRLNEFTDLITESAKELFNSNQIYTNLDAETDYVKKIVTKTIPPEYLSDNIKVYIVRDPSINAYCREDGSIFIHIGLLSILDNEAELAGILAHEFGHYFSRHSLKGYKKRKTTVALNAGFAYLGILGYIPSLISISKYYRDSRKQEKESDLFGVKFFKQNQFAHEGIISAQEKFVQYVNVYKKRAGYKKSLYIFHTHPSSEKRITYLKKDIAKNNLSLGKKFIVDSLTFEKLRRRANDETIYLNFSQGDLDACIERAYLNHLYFPNDDYYTYFLLEALRRKTSLFPATKNDRFITSAFKLKAKGNRSEKHVKLSIHHQLQSVYGWELKAYEKYVSSPDSALINPNQAEFVSNAEALVYLSKIAEEKCDGCYPVMKRMDKHYEKPLAEQEKTELEALIYEQTFLPLNTPGDSKNMCFPFFLNNYYESTRGKKEIFEYSIPPNSYISIELNKHNNSEKREDGFCSELIYTPELNFRDTYQMNALLKTISQKLVFDNNPGEKKLAKDFFFPKQNKDLKTIINLESDMPELLLIAKKYHFKKLYFADILENDSNPKYNNGTIFGTLIYCLDFNTNTVTRYAYQFFPGSWPDVSGYYSEITNAINEVFNKTK